MFKAENLCFAHAHSYKNISLTIPYGTLACLLGSNGAGKSSLLRALVGIIPLQNGKISLGDSIISELPRKKIAQYIAYVPQIPSLAHLNVYEAVLMGRTAYMRFTPSKADKNAVEKALYNLNIQDWRDLYIDELSGGQLQKVILARALAQESQVLLLDEPTRSLDIRYQLELYELLKNICATENKIILVVEHDLNLALHYADSVYVLHNGIMQSSGKAQEVLNSQLLHDVYGINANIYTTSNGSHIIYNKLIGV